MKITAKDRAEWNARDDTWVWPCTIGRVFQGRQYGRDWEWRAETMTSGKAVYGRTKSAAIDAAIRAERRVKK